MKKPPSEPRSKILPPPSLRTTRFFLAALALLTGCRSHYIQVSITNHTNHPLRVVELDYPSASFGASVLAPHASYNYRFKAQGSGPLALSYTEPPATARAATGPIVHEGEQGSLSIDIRDHGAVTWQPSLR